MEKDDLVTITFQAPRTWALWISALAERLEISRAEFIREAVEIGANNITAELLASKHTEAQKEEI